MLTISEQKCQFASFVFDEYQRKAYYLGECASEYDEADMEERKLDLTLAELDFDCTPFLVRESSVEMFDIKYKPLTGGGACKVIIQNIYNKYTYHHSQPIASDTWIINHGLNYIPGMPLVTDLTDTQISGLVTGESPTQMIIKFSEPVAGHAYLS